MDKRAKIREATRVLEEYDKQDKIRNRGENALSAVQYSGMPTGSSKGNPEENKIVNHASADMYCKTVEDAIDRIKNSEYQDILRMTYIKPTGSTAIIYSKLNITRPTYYRHLDSARAEFADICSLVKIETKVRQC